MEKVETDRQSGIEMCMCPACIGKIIPFHLFFVFFCHGSFGKKIVALFIQRVRW